MQNISYLIHQNNLNVFHVHPNININMKFYLVHSHLLNTGVVYLKSNVTDIKQRKLKIKICIYIIFM